MPMKQKQFTTNSMSKEGPKGIKCKHYSYVFSLYLFPKWYIFYFHQTLWVRGWPFVQDSIWAAAPHPLTASQTLVEQRDWLQVGGSPLHSKYNRASFLFSSQYHLVLNWGQVLIVDSIDLQILSYSRLSMGKLSLCFKVLKHKKGTFCLISVLEVRFCFFTCVLESEFRACFI